MNFRRPQARPASLIGRPSANIAKRPNSTIAGGVGRASYGRMIVIDIFKENHRFSEQTSHPAPGSVFRCGQPGCRPPRCKQPREQYRLPQFVIWSF
jgi:hypothetical protein